MVYNSSAFVHNDDVSVFSDLVFTHHPVYIINHYVNSNCAHYVSAFIERACYSDCNSAGPRISVRLAEVRLLGSYHVDVPGPLLKVKSLWRVMFIYICYYVVYLSRSYIGKLYAFIYSLYIDKLLHDPAIERVFTLGLPAQRF